MLSLGGGGNSVGFYFNVLVHLKSGLMRGWPLGKGLYKRGATLYIPYIIVIGTIQLLKNIKLDT